jgi:phosphoribosylanthranilate isomerase
MRDPENILKVAEEQPAYMGFIFYDQSPRYVGQDFFIPTEFPDSIKRVGVFVNEKVDVILGIVKKYNLELVQLHGTESPEQCEELANRGVSIIKAFSIDTQFDFEETKPFGKYVDYFLFDTKGKHFGGNAKVFDWSQLNRYDQRIPFFLSGGLTVVNIQKINELKNMNVHALDVNSGLEALPGVKDVDKVKEFKRVMSSITQ